MGGDSFPLAQWQPFFVFGGVSLQSPATKTRAPFFAPGILRLLMVPQFKSPPPWSWWMAWWNFVAPKAKMVRYVPHLSADFQVT